MWGGGDFFILQTLNFYQWSSIIFFKRSVDSSEAVKARNWFAGYAMFGAGVTTGTFYFNSKIADRFLTECNVVR